MGSEELRALQTPLKERYRADPEAAVVTLSATGELGDGISCSVRTAGALASAGLHPASGGDGSLLCSGDMLLEALVACAGVTLRAVCTSENTEFARRPGSRPQRCLVGHAGGACFPRKADRSGGQATEVGSFGQESLPERREGGCGVGASLWGVVAGAECVEQVCAVGGHQ